MLESAEAVTDVEIERAAKLFEVPAEEADQFLVIYKMSVTFAENVRAEPVRP
jgi:hypothetical protein